MPRVTPLRLVVMICNSSLAGCAASSASTPGGDPVPRDVTAVSPGATVYARSCAGCHGDAGKGGSAERIAGHPAWATRDVLKLPVGPMSGVKLPAEDRDAVANYVAGLK